MRVAIVTPRFPPNGGEDYSYHMAKAIMESGHKVVVHTPHQGKTTTITYKGIMVRQYKIYGSFGEFAKLWFPDLKDFDVVHLCGGYRHPHMYWSYIFSGYAKLIMSPFFPVKPRANKVHGLIQPIIDSTLGVFMLRAADAVLAETDIEAQWLYDKMGVSPSKIKMIPNPLEDKYYQPYDGKKFRHKYGITGKMVFFLGGHSFIKNVGDLLEATPKVKAKFVIGGQGPLTGRYKRRLAELGTLDKVIFPGTFFDNPDEKFEAMAAADVFVLPSLMEGLGGVLIEAMAQGTPVIAANRGGLPDVVPDKYCLYKPGDIAELQMKINSVLTEKAISSKLSELGSIKAKEYAFSKISKEYIKILEEVTRNGN